ncbi:DUF2141 domain-containing protein [Sphingomonas sp.]|uniref:DUF2141 domain-containing protein n=1 Tax=Sphingomonas sp. TaxID=28214 RepID=UPI002DD6431E|nr:DUF2141 domain-containing protein [Sphingomonas sp.]
MILIAALIAAQSVNADDSDACRTGQGPAISVAVTGLKDRTGRLKLELYPATEADFLKDDRDLVREGKTFRRTWAATPASGPVTLCIRAPAPGRYALLFTHDRDGKNKFNFWRDGAGFVGDARLGRSRPKLAQAVVTVGPGITSVSIRAQYLRGLGFAPLEAR